jgi:hypothetical protein
MIDTVDTAEFRMASKAVSMVILGIDTIDTPGSTLRTPGTDQRRGEKRAAILSSPRPGRRPLRSGDVGRLSGPLSGSRPRA